MNQSIPKASLGTRRFGWAAALTFVFAASVSAQSGGMERADYVAPLTPGKSAVVQTGCASCDAGLGPTTHNGPGLFDSGRGLYGGGCSSCGCGDGGCGENGCVAGRAPCETCEGYGPFRKAVCMVHNALCCPDPCFEPRWTLPPNAALFVDSARPTTQMMFRWDSGHSAGSTTLLLRTEVGTERFSMFVDQPWRLVDLPGGSVSGFGDLSIGTKSVLLDSELFVSTFRFTTFIPTGTGAVSAGHVSLEPAFLTSVKLCSETYFQSELGVWIPIGGGATAGSESSKSVFIFNHSINQTLCRPTSDMVLVGTLELTGYHTTGTYFDPAQMAGLPATGTYLAIGPGLRYGFCDKLDVGFGVQFRISGDASPQQLYRTEVRWRF